MRAFSRFRDDTQGTVTIEFMLTFPLLVMWLIGSFVFFDIYKSESKTSKAAYAIADIMSRKEKVTVAELSDYYTLLDRMLPRASDSKWMRISSIGFDEDAGSYFVNWSHVTTPDPTIEALEDDDIDVAVMPLIADNDSVVFVEIWVPYTPLVDWFAFRDMRWYPQVAMRPRFIARVVCTDCVVS